jgi:hypothetical protein
MRSFTEFEEFECVTCAIKFWVPDGYIDARRNDGHAFHCPNGHQMTFRETEADRVRKERDRLKQNEAYLESRISSLAAQRDMAERRIAAAKGQITKIKKRASNGVCPCCNRTFADLARHMAGKHPGFVAEPTADEHVH